MALERLHTSGPSFEHLRHVQKPSWNLLGENVLDYALLRAEYQTRIVYLQRCFFKNWLKCKYEANGVMNQNLCSWICFAKGGC